MGKKICLLLFLSLLFCNLVESNIHEGSKLINLVQDANNELVYSENDNNGENLISQLGLCEPIDCW